MKKIVVLLEKMVEDSEFQYPYLRLKEEGFEVTSVAPEKKCMLGKLVKAFNPTRLLQRLKIRFLML